MPVPTTILLTSRDPSLFGALRTLRPELHAMPIGPDVPSDGYQGPVLCFVDWLLPDMSGLEMIRRLREVSATRDGHITMVLDPGDTEARSRAMRAGADDYLIGPLDLDKLAERIALHARELPRAEPARGRLVHGELHLDLAAHQARFGAMPIALRPNEFNLLAHFLQNPDQVFTRTALIERIGKDSDLIDERTVDVWIGRLRRALSAHGVPDPLRTVRSLGYVLDSIRN